MKFEEVKPYFDKGKPISCVLDGKVTNYACYKGQISFLQCNEDHVVMAPIKEIHKENIDLAEWRVGDDYECYKCPHVYTITKCIGMPEDMPETLYACRILGGYWTPKYWEDKE